MKRAPLKYFYFLEPDGAISKVKALLDCDGRVYDAALVDWDPQFGRRCLATWRAA